MENTLPFVIVMITGILKSLKSKSVFFRKITCFLLIRRTEKINENGDELGVIQAPPATSFIGMLKSCEIGCLTAIYDLDKIGKVEMPNIPLSEDYGLWLKIFKIIGSTKGMGEVLAYYRVRKSSISSNKLKAAKYHFKVIIEIGGVSFLKACYYFVFYAVEGLKKVP
ncbi:MAG: hypothetical protein MZV64_15620 [Ignavibacteriales bacterium]|nr:hypothetical protein [Ignavibacteriales bacterium]